MQYQTVATSTSSTNPGFEVNLTERSECVNIQYSIYMDMDMIFKSIRQRWAQRRNVMELRIVWLILTLEVIATCLPEYHAS